jgi:hypothetical protein
MQKLIFNFFTKGQPKPKKMIQVHRFCQCCGYQSGGSVINWPPGSGSVIQDYGSTYPDPKEISTDPQDWFFQCTKSPYNYD